MPHILAVKERQRNRSRTEGSECKALVSPRAADGVDADIVRPWRNTDNGRLRSCPLAQCQHSCISSCFTPCEMRRGLYHQSPTRQHSIAPKAEYAGL